MTMAKRQLSSSCVLFSFSLMFRSVLVDTILFYYYYYFFFFLFLVFLKIFFWEMFDLRVTLLVTFSAFKSSVFVVRKIYMGKIYFLKNFICCCCMFVWRLVWWGWSHWRQRFIDLFLGICCNTKHESVDKPLHPALTSLSLLSFSIFWLLYIIFSVWLLRNWSKNYILCLGDCLLCLCRL